MPKLDPKRLSVEQWGYSCINNQELQALAWPVRFKPGVTFFLVLAGLLIDGDRFLIALGGFGLLGTAMPKLSWLDGLYHHLVRHLFKAPPLPPDPALRRAACGTADLCILVSGTALALGHLRLAWIFGGLVLVLSGSVLITGICLPVVLIHRRLKKD